MTSKLIISVAHFVICPNCGQHGHIILSNKTQIEEAYKEGDALEQVKLLYSERIIIEVERDFLNKQIRDSTIPIEDVRPKMKRIQEVIHDTVGGEVAIGPKCLTFDSTSQSDEKMTLH